MTGGRAAEFLMFSSFLGNTRPLLVSVQQDGWEIVGTGNVVPGSLGVPESLRVGLLWRHVGSGDLYAEEMRVPPGKQAWAVLLAHHLASFGYEPYILDVPRSDAVSVKVLVSRHPLLGYQASSSGGTSTGRKKRKKSDGRQADTSGG